MNGVQTRFKCKLDVKRCKRFVFPPSSLLPRSNALKTKAIRYFQTDRTLTRIVSPPLQKEKEGELILKALQPGDVVVLLDEGGKEMRSIEFADYMKRKMNTVNKRLVFIIGGPYGFSPKVYEAAHEKMSLSRMTFSHQMVRLIFVEQLYRAMTILNGGPYHHE